MASAVDTTFPADSVKVSKSEFRAQMTIINDEITALQKQIAAAGKQAFDTGLGAGDVKRIVQEVNRTTLARDLAFGRVSL